MKRLVIKLGGRVIEDESCTLKLLLDLNSLLQLNEYSIILIHGGGNKITEYCNNHQIPVRFDDQGRRVTTEVEMNISDMILAGSINTGLLRLCVKTGLEAVGLTCADCGLVLARSMDDSFTGYAGSCNLRIINLLCSQKIIPIISSVSCDTVGRAYNINADEIAQTIAQEWKTQYLIFISDTAGILYNNNVIRHLNPKTIAEYIDQGLIQRGMKIKSLQAIEALNKGVESITIGNFEKQGDLLSLINNLQGTQISNVS